jgi:hypothetical protein
VPVRDSTGSQFGFHKNKFFFVCCPCVWRQRSSLRLASCSSPCSRLLFICVFVYLRLPPRVRTSGRLLGRGWADSPSSLAHPAGPERASQPPNSAVLRFQQRQTDTGTTLSVKSGQQPSCNNINIFDIFVAVLFCLVVSLIH